MNGPVPYGSNPTAKSEGSLRRGLERLARLVNETEELNEKLQNTFGLLVVSQPCCTEPPATPRPIASEIGQTLQMLTDRIDTELSKMRQFLDSADI